MKHLKKRLALAAVVIAAVFLALLGNPRELAIVFFFIAAVFAFVFPTLYFFGSPWRSTLVGKMMMTKSSSIALVFLLSILFRYIPNFPMRDWLIVVAYAYLAVALCFQTTVLLVEQKRQRAEKRSRYAGLQHDREDV